VKIVHEIVRDDNIFYMLFRVNRAPHSVTSTTRCGSVNLSLWWGQIYLWTTPVASPLCRQVWGWYLNLFPRDSTNFCRFKIVETVGRPDHEHGVEFGG